MLTLHRDVDSALPITHGNLLDFPADPLACMRKLQQKHGNVAALQQDGTKIYFAFGPEYNHQVLSDSQTFHSRFFAIRGSRNSSQRRLTSGLLSMNGDEHKQQRRMVMDAFLKKAIQGYLPAIKLHVEQMLADWQPGKERDIARDMTEFMLRLTSSILFGMNNPDLAYRIGRMIDHWVHLNHELGMGAYISSPEISDRYDELLSFAGELEVEIAGLIRQRRSGDGGPDMLSMILQAHDDQGRISDDQLVGQYASLPHSSRVQFTRDDGGHMYVTVWLNNHPLRAIFDTVAHAHFGLNHLAKVGVAMPANAEKSYTSGWAGKPVPIWVMDADLKLGDVKRRVPITVEENMSLPPLVGQEFLKEMRYEIDDKGGVMTLSKARTSKTDTSYSSIYDVPCIHLHGDDVIPVQIQGRKASAIIDTGAQITIFSPDTLKSLGIEIPPDAPVTSIGGVGGSLRCYVVELDLQVGPVRKQNFRTLVGGSAGNAIGQDFLQGWRYTVDQERHLMRFFH